MAGKIKILVLGNSIHLNNLVIPHLSYLVCFQAIDIDIFEASPFRISYHIWSDDIFTAREMKYLPKVTIKALQTLVFNGGKVTDCRFKVCLCSRE